MGGRFPGRKLEWDSAQMQVTNVADANAFLKLKYRSF
jgi:hypothetical protein